MNERRRVLELLVMGGCAFILTQAIISMILVLEPSDPPGEGNSLWRLILIACYLGVALILAPYLRETRFIVRRNLFLVALIFLALVSCSWAAKPALVLQHSIAVLGTTLLGIALAVLLTVEDQLQFLSRLFRIIAVLSLACIVFLPSYGISRAADSHGEWQGIFSHKNGLGSIMALSVLVEWQLPADTRYFKIVKRLALLLSMVLLAFSGSLTSMFALIGSLLFIEMYKFAAKRLRIPLYAIVLGTLLIVASGVTLLFMNTETVTAAFGRSSDLTGRTEIWSWVLSYIPQQPILGYGYSGFWSGASPESAVIDRAMGTMIMYSHNGYLEILLSLGVVGFLVTLGFLAIGIKRAYYFSNHDRSSVNLWPIAFLSFFLLHNLAEGTILMQDLEWAICVATIVGADAALIARDVEREVPFPFAPSEEMT
jgi:exopolysaccharide production protein ExoQ